jgi:hypothetical protein
LELHSFGSFFFFGLFSQVELFLMETPNTTIETLRVLEFYSGIGGMHAALTEALAGNIEMI